MRYAIIVNPIAGNGGHDKGVVKNIEDLVVRYPEEDIGIYYTRCEKDAEKIAETVAAEAMRAGDDIVVFSCGGDGTAHEVANGLYGYDNAILGLVPIGSGNDLCRELAREKNISYRDYLNFDKQMRGAERKIDVMKISWEEDGEAKSCISINSINIGFDGNTAARATELKKKTFFKGSMAYIAGVFSTLVTKEGQSLHITADGEEFYEGDLLLATLGNGGYCGGGIRSCPFALLDDEEIELMAIKDINRSRFIRLFPRFRAGRIFELKNVDDLVTYKRAKSVEITPLLDDTMRYVVDGEVMTTGKIHIEIEPEAFTVWEI